MSTLSIVLLSVGGWLIAGILTMWLIIKLEAEPTEPTEQLTLKDALIIVALVCMWPICLFILIRDRAPDLDSIVLWRRKPKVQLDAALYPVASKPVRGRPLP